MAPSVLTTGNATIFALKTFAPITSFTLVVMVLRQIDHKTVRRLISAIRDAALRIILVLDSVKPDLSVHQLLLDGITM